MLSQSKREFTFRTMVRRGCRLARPPGGSVEQPVVNCRNAFLSSDDIPHRTLTKRRNPGLLERPERRYIYRKKNSTNCNQTPAVNHDAPPLFIISI